ncbi:hypothetical protein GCM10011349_36040 [Novosphingobium indicum]|uniref:Uncharacterized protein n=1 Tax=Novosphingobium indicum TaxID=462949 RepID=A0ABQ2JU61_9SPHN
MRGPDWTPINPLRGSFCTPVHTSGMIPFVGGILAAIAGMWSEKEQAHAENVLRQWIQMLEDELREKGKTIAEIMARLDMQDEETVKRIESPEYQALLKKSFRKWSSIDTEGKREKIRNILSNAAGSSVVSDDVISLFIDWLDQYSDFHFQVIGEVYRSPGITRGGIWENLGRKQVQENSADADLYRMLIRDLSMGGVIRQHRQTDYHGNFIKKTPAKTGKGQGSKVMTSAFDRVEQYELTELGKQFVHYAMNELAPKLTFHESA